MKLKVRFNIYCIKRWLWAARLTLNTNIELVDSGMYAGIFFGGGGQNLQNSRYKVALFYLVTK